MGWKSRMVKNWGIFKRQNIEILEMFPVKFIDSYWHLTTPCDPCKNTQIVNIFDTILK